MKYFLLLLLTIPALFARPNLLVGDIIFVTFRPCFICSLIEQEVGSKYSHLGLVLEVSANDIWIVEARGKVRKIKIEDFLLQASRADIFRLKELHNNNRAEFEHELRFRYYQYFDDLPYDSNFLWDNTDGKGREMLYCSELITKLLNPLLNDKIGIQPMSFLLNYNLWQKYFAPNPVPQGMLGNNPQSLFNDLDLVFIGTLVENKNDLEE